MDSDINTSLPINTNGNWISKPWTSLKGKPAEVGIFLRLEEHSSSTELWWREKPRTLEGLWPAFSSFRSKTPSFHQSSIPIELLFCLSSRPQWFLSPPNSVPNDCVIPSGWKQRARQTVPQARPALWWDEALRAVPDVSHKYHRNYKGLTEH